MTKHDRLINALAEIKDICLKNDDYEIGCGRKCPFLMGKEGDVFRDCEIMVITQQGINEFHVVDTPEDWGIPDMPKEVSGDEQR